MDRAGEMTAFVRAVETGGFSAAARDLGLTPSALSKLVTRLGDRLGARLFHATGSYDTIWGICILLGVVAALCHLPIDERSLEVRRQAVAT